jgi:hypothetical protein
MLASSNTPFRLLTITAVKVWLPNRKIDMKKTGTITGSTDQVDEFMVNLDHPFNAEVQLNSTVISCSKIKEIQNEPL